MSSERSLGIYQEIGGDSDGGATLLQVSGGAKNADAVIVLFDAEKITGKNHIRSAVLHAERSFASEKPIARTLSMEILLYASGQRQCSLAPQFGLHTGRNFLYVAVLGGDAGLAKRLLAEVAVPNDHQMTAPVPDLMELLSIPPGE